MGHFTHVFTSRGTIVPVFEHYHGLLPPEVEPIGSTAVVRALFNLTWKCCNDSILTKYRELVPGERVSMVYSQLALASLAADRTTAKLLIDLIQVAFFFPCR